MRQPKALIFGGSFDPPHMGHMGLLQAAIAAVVPQRVLVVPSGMAPHKQASQTPASLRAAMCECFRPLFPALEISGIELARPGKSYTCETVEQLRQAAPDTSWFLCIGGDMLLSFDTWYRWQDLLRMVTLVVLGRQEGQDSALTEAADGLRRAGGQVLFAPGPTVELSSSALREAIAQGRDVWGQIPPPADAVVRENGLYLDD